MQPLTLEHAGGLDAAHGKAHVLAVGVGEILGENFLGRLVTDRWNA